MPELSFTRRRLESIVNDALRSAGVLGVVPTPLAALRAAADIRGVEPIERLPPGPALPDRPVLGALWFEARTLYIDERQSAPRRRFTEAHELVHALCPWHEAALRLDTERELFRPIATALEAEANAGASLVIFQGRECGRRAGPGPPSIARAIELAAEFEASTHATLHHIVEAHPSAAAMLAVGRFPLRDGSLPIWRSVESPAFAARFGALRATGVHADGALREVIEAARSHGRAATVMSFPVHTGHTRRCAVETYYNRHAFLVLITAEPIARRNQRVASAELRDVAAVLE